MITSGAIQKGVPTKVFRLFIDSVSWPATPKSASFTLPLSDSSTFAAEIIKVSGVGGEKEEWERKGEEGGDRVGEEGGNTRTYLTDRLTISEVRRHGCTDITR